MDKAMNHCLPSTSRAFHRGSDWLSDRTDRQESGANRSRTSSRRISRTDSLQSRWCISPSLTRRNLSDHYGWMDCQWTRAVSFPLLTYIYRISHENGISCNPKYELMVPGVGHLLSLGDGPLHVHGRHGNSAFLDPVCEPGDQLHLAAGVKVEEATNHLPFTGLLCSCDKLSVSRT